QLSRRERQIMDILFRLGPSSAAEIRQAMPDAPSYSAVRTHLRILGEKGHIRHEHDGPRYVYRPTVAQESAEKSALERLVKTFFGGSPERAMAALLDTSAPEMSDAELDRLEGLIQQAREREERS
ncbi:MAG: BlaI/MecI/CopY family transcriptional regulator, partial [Acidobacteriota bacterium]